jgi:hypothetical protein
LIADEIKNLNNQKVESDRKSNMKHETQIQDIAHKLQESDRSRYEMADKAGSTSK